MDFFTQPIVEAIEICKSHTFSINRNYEIIISGERNLLDYKHFGIGTLKALYEDLYRNYQEHFFPDNIEIDLIILKKRLDHLAMFLSKIGQDSKPVEMLLKTIRKLDTSRIKLESVTLRIFDEFGIQILAKDFMHPAVLPILKGFCYTREMSKDQLLEAVTSLKSDQINKGDFLTTKEVSEELGISYSKIVKDAKNNILKCSAKSDKGHLFHIEDIKEYKENPISQRRPGRQKLNTQN